MWKLYIEDDGSGHSGCEVEMGFFKSKPTIKQLKEKLVNHKKCIGKKGFNILLDNGSYQPPTSWNTYVLKKIEFSD